MFEAEKMEPADRNSKAVRRGIRNTVLVLVALMIGGGIFIWRSYVAEQERRNEPISDGYLPRISALTKNFQFLDHDATVRQLSELDDKVSIFACIAPSQPKENEVVLAAMKQLSETFADEPRVQLVCLSVEGESDAVRAKLGEISKSIVSDSEKWWFLSAEEGPIRAFIKDRLEIGAIETYSAEKSAIYGPLGVPGKLRIVDQARQLRGQYEDFDFEAYLQVEAAAKLEIQNNPALAKIPEASRHLNASVLEMEKMIRCIRYILENPEEAKEPDYNFAIAIFLGIGVFIVILGAKYRRTVKAKQR